MVDKRMGKFCFTEKKFTLTETSLYMYQYMYIYLLPNRSLKSEIVRFMLTFMVIDCKESVTSVRQLLFMKEDCVSYAAQLPSLNMCAELRYARDKENEIDNEDEKHSAQPLVASFTRWLSLPHLLFKDSFFLFSRLKKKTVITLALYNNCQLDDQLTAVIRGENQLTCQSGIYVQIESLFENGVRGGNSKITM